jgi:hypothetical protein
MIVDPGAFCTVVFLVHRHYTTYSDRLLGTRKKERLDIAANLFFLFSVLLVVSGAVLDTGLAGEK